jgi:DNA-binding NtrC family response regulator
MPSIRSLLWIGSGRGLAASGISEAPELDVTWVPDLAEAGTLPRVPFDGVLLEAGRVGAIGAAVARARGIGRGVPVLVCLPEAESIEAETALAAGAAAVLFLDPEAPRPGFVRAVGDALDAQHEGAAPTLPEPAPAFDEAASPLVARSTAMREVAALVAVAASSPSTVLLTGETGAGKEVVARQLHTRSDRAVEPFVPINCAAFPEALLESELFGHVKGAFTGADRTKPGLFEVAGAGTLFLDEIAEMDLTLQAKLLRVLQEREIRPIGGTRSVAVHCRIVAATNRVLPDEVRSGHFREDLFYRLNVFPIRVPPLRERRKGHPPPRPPFPRAPRPARGQARLPSLARDRTAARELRLARQRPRARERDAARPDADALRLADHAEGPLAQARRDPRADRPRQQPRRDPPPGRRARRGLADPPRPREQRRPEDLTTARRLGLTREGFYKKLKRLGIE